jgi:hypothetical protein
MVPDLCHNHKRPDLKITPTERSRITTAFILTYRIILDTPAGNLSVIQWHVARLSPTHILHVREIAMFMFNNMDAEQHREIARLMGYRKDDVVERLLEVLQAANECYAEKGLPGIHQPDFSPRGLGLLFDDWQESYVESMAEDYERNARRMAKGLRV